MDRKNIVRAAGIAAILAFVASIMLHYHPGWAELSILAVLAAALIVVLLRLF